MRQTPNVVIALLLTVLIANMSCSIQTPVDVSHHAVALDTGWKFLAGDDPRWASPDFDDASWADIDPYLDITEFKKRLAGGKVGWLRKSFQIPGEWVGRSAAISMTQAVASDIFLDGNVVEKFGVIDPTGRNTRTYDPNYAPISFDAEPGSGHIIAVRLGISGSTRYTTLFEFPNSVFKAHVSPSNEALLDFRMLYSRLTGFMFLLVGVNTMIFLIHCFFYIMNRKQVANLFVSLAGLLYLLGYIFQDAYFLSIPDHTTRYFTANFVYIGYELANFLVFLAIHQFLGRKLKWDIWIMLFLILASIPLNLFWYNYGWRFGGIVCQLLTWLNLVRICILEARNKKKGAKVFAAGAFAAIVFFFAFLTMGAFSKHSDFLHNLSPIRQLLYVLSWLGVTGSISAYLAWDFSQTSRQLARKLAEVEDLSNRNLAMEMEKREILAEQNILLERRVDERTEALNRSLQDLRATQTQLIQSEKMASLGELTAGIAHEIQNPLNFVNNFSDLNKELIVELQEGLGKGEIGEASSIAENIRENEEKINHHGRRADGIVKSMLQHSRPSAGQQEPTDLAALAEEYLNLAFHGLRVKDKSFNVTLETVFDPDLPKVNVVPQDIGLVLLNLYNNAFQAVAERAGRSDAGYEPKVRVEIRGVGGQHAALSSQEGSLQGRQQSAAVDPRSSILDPRFVSLRVTDNGLGIPESIRDKVFQPFFTTKPTGQGTGLGLSLSYDIVKAHGGTLTLVPGAGDGAIFEMVIPVS